MPRRAAAPSWMSRRNRCTNARRSTWATARSSPRPRSSSRSTTSDHPPGSAHELLDEVIGRERVAGRAFDELIPPESFSRGEYILAQECSHGGCIHDGGASVGSLEHAGLDGVVEL